MALFVFENLHIYTCFINIYTFFSDLLCLKFINLIEMDQSHLYSTVWSHRFMNSLVMVLRFSIFIITNKAAEILFFLKNDFAESLSIFSF